MPPQRRDDHLGAAGHMQRTARARQPGVDQLAAEHAAVGARQLQPHLVELAALRLVHGHRERGLVRGQRGGMEGARTDAAFAGEPGQRGAVGVGQADADVAVEHGSENYAILLEYCQLVISTLTH